eukprot:9263648-Lingulodinium_polyedra.AAC.1
MGKAREGPLGSESSLNVRGCRCRLLQLVDTTVDLKEGLPGASFWRYVHLRGAPCRPYAGLRRAPRRLHVALFGLVSSAFFVLASRRRGSAG